MIEKAASKCRLLFTPLVFAGGVTRLVMGCSTRFAANWPLPDRHPSCEQKEDASNLHRSNERWMSVSKPIHDTPQNGRLLLLLKNDLI